MIFGVDTIKSDLEYGITPLLLAQPIKRWWYLLTRIIGSSAMVFSYYLLSFLMAWIIFFVSDGATNVNWSLIGALLGTCLVIVAVITISAFFTLFMGKLVAFVLSFILIGIINLGNTTFSSIAFSDHFRDLGIAKILGLITYYFFPRIGLWSSLSSSLINGSQPDFNYAIELAHYSVTIFILFFLIAIFFQKREM